jgi:putative glutamine amidotransferase
VRLEGAGADILLPGEGASFPHYLDRLRESGVFRHHGGTLDALAGAPMAPPLGRAAATRLARGQKDATAWSLQAALNRLAQREGAPELGAGKTDGSFGEKTEAAVRAFQTRAGLVVDGIAGPQTLGAIEDALARHGITALKLRGAAHPRIGIIALDPGKLTAGDGEIQRFIDLATRTGCRAVLVPPCADVLVEGGASERDAAIAAMIARLDGILGLGGDDVDPAIYGEENRYARGTNYRRDRFEADFVLAAMEELTFLFGICRSHQLWNAAAGGTLVQDLVKEGYSHLSQSQADFNIDGQDPFVVRRPDGRLDFENKVVLSAGCAISKVLDGARLILTNSYHHQAVDAPGKGFVAVGTVFDKVTKRHTIEAAERWNVITTQFHPEGMQRDDKQRELLETLGRRAMIFRMLDTGARGVGDLLERMAQLPDGIFDGSDLEWVREDLARRLG